MPALGSSKSSRIPSSAATNNATVASAVPGRLNQLIVYNSNAAARYVKFYDKATAPNPAADTPVLSFAIPPTTAASIMIDGFVFLTGIGYATVTGAADNDNTAVGAGELLGLNVLFN